MKYVVTGSEGFLGRNIANRLLSLGHHVKGYDNLRRGHQSIAHENYIFKRSSVLHQGDLDFEGYDCVIHCAAINGTENFYKWPGEVLEVGIQGTRNVLEKVRIDRIPKLIFLSSSEVYATPEKIPTDESAWLQIPDIRNPRFSYAVSKIAGEAMILHPLLEDGETRIIIRPHNIFGPDSGHGHVIPDLIEKIKKSDRVEIQGTGKETRAFMFVDDFVDAFMLILQKGENRGIYHVGSSEEVTIERVVEEIGHQFGRTIEIVPGTLRPGSPLRRCPDVRKLKDLGFSHKTSFEEGIKATVAWYENH